MQERYYIDTSIWIDIYEDRRGYHNEPLGYYALKLFAILKAKEKVIVISDLLLREIETFYTMAEIRGLMKPFEGIIEKVIATRVQREEAKKLARERDIPPGDALHAILARDNRLILITRDKDFRKLTDICRHYKPEDII